MVWSMAKNSPPRGTQRVGDADASRVSGQVVVGAEPAALPRWGIIPICAGWFALWYLTPGLLDNGVGRLFTDDPAGSVLIETVVALALALVLVMLHRRYNRVLFARSRLAYLYGLPLVLAVALPFHYELSLPVALYIFWITVSVFWQDYLTFGLLQSYLGEWLPARVQALVVAVMFYLGHAVLIPDRFGPSSVLPALAILTLGLTLSLLRAKLGTLHLILALHLSFYFLFA